MSFENEWESFLWGIENTIERGEVYGGLDPEGVESLINEIMQVLRSEDARREIRNAARTVDEQTHGLLLGEIELWNDAVDTTRGDRGSGEFPNVDAERTKNPKQRLTQAKTVKESIEELLSIPSWLRKPLTILNEVLDLIT